MSSRPLLSQGSEADEVVRLRREIAGLERELQEAKDEASRAKQASSDAIHAIRSLRKNLEPLYASLKMIFGEISRVDAQRFHEDATTQAGRDPRWDSWKSRVSGRAGEIIELLLIHREMNTKQLAAAMHCDPRTIANPIYELNKASLLIKNGGVFSLKSL